MKTFAEADKLRILADEGDLNSIDDGCILLFSVVRDCSYRIRKEAEREKKSHQNKGMWE